MKLHELVFWLDETLDTQRIADYPGAFNGLQLENRGHVERVAVAVDACESVLAQAAGNADLLLVHHGLFWSGSAPWTGATYRKIKVAIDNNLAVYSSHLPLDLHPDLGNNAVLARRIGMPEPRPFLEMKGREIGLQADWEIPLPELLNRIAGATGSDPHFCPGGPGTAKRVGLVTGGAGSEIAAAAALGVDTFITGEGPHWSYTLAEELGVNLVYAGHYATETFGVCALAERMQSLFGLPWHFIDHPTGL
jgi:dinuclear metal center YbgI/SA1388 family protein